MNYAWKIWCWSCHYHGFLQADLSRTTWYNNSIWSLLLNTHCNTAIKQAMLKRLGSCLCYWQFCLVTMIMVHCLSVKHMLMISPMHYNDVIMSVMASEITSLMIVYSTFYSGTDQRKHKSSTSLAFVRGVHQWPTGEFLAQRASNAENVSISWRHHRIPRVASLSHSSITILPKAC